MEPKRVLIKFGGAAMKDSQLASRLFKAVSELVNKGVEVTFVHGGGPEIDSMLKRLSIEPQKLNGLRVTDAATMEVVEMVLAAKVNKSLVTQAQKFGLNAIGLSAIDALIAIVSKKSEDFGLVGTIEKVNSNCLKLLQSQGYFPILCSIAQDTNGTHMNINADELAAALAGSMQVDLFVMVTDVPGLMRDYPNPNSVISKLTINELPELLTSGAVSSGMIPKVQACQDALTKGARAALITDMVYSDLENFLETHAQPKGTLVI